MPSVLAFNVCAVSLLLAAVSLGAPRLAVAGDAAVVSGTIQYIGSGGPVSAERPILLLLWDNFDLDGAPVAVASVEINGGAFELTAPAPGEYFLAYILDTNGDATPAVGDPFEVYQDRFSIPADPLQAPQADLVLSFTDGGSLPGVRGTVTYTGSMGPVSETSPLRVDVFRDGNLTDRLDQRLRLVANGAPYQVILIDSRFQFLRAFVDLNDSGELDPDEPFTIYDDRTQPPGDPLPQGVADVDISFGDEAIPTPTPTPTPGNPVSLSGTIEYTGARGPVSADRPILLFLSTNPTLDGAPVSGTFVDTNGGAFELMAPAPGDYYLAYLLDTNGDTAPAVGDPFEVYLDHTTIPGDPITLPQSGLALSFDDTGGLPGVQGTVTYTGGLGPVSEDQPLLVDAYRDADLTDRLDQQSLVVENGGAFAFILLATGEHYLMAFLDLNRNDVRDDGEPFTIYDDRTAPPGDPLPRDGSMVDLVFGDGDLPTPTATPTPTPTPGGPCVGDCNGDGDVTVDEIILGTEIALGHRDTSECPRFDPDASGTVTVAELVRAVHNSINGCAQAS